MSTRKDQLLRRAAGNDRSRAVALTREEKALREFLEEQSDVTATAEAAQATAEAAQAAAEAAQAAADSSASKANDTAIKLASVIANADAASKVKRSAVELSFPETGALDHYLAVGETIAVPNKVYTDSPRAGDFLMVTAELRHGNKHSILKFSLQFYSAYGLIGICPMSGTGGDAALELYALYVNNSGNDYARLTRIV